MYYQTKESKVKKVMGKKYGLWSILIVVLALSFPGCAAAVEWDKYVTADGAFSFHYPQGWTVSAIESGFMIYEPDTYEQIWLVVLPYQNLWTAQDHAEFFLSLIQEDYPDMQATSWELAEDGAFFELVYGSGRQRAEGMGLVLKDNQSKQALWFHYLTPADAYLDERAETILEGFVNSLAAGDSSQRPAARSAVSEPVDRPARIDRNADAFLFILEFALGTPLSLSEETIILTELKDAWRRYSDAELAVYDDYPSIVQVIMYLPEQAELAELQEALEASLWEWAEASDPEDPIVRLIHVHMLTADRRLVDGNIPLTERAAASYAEFLAYADLLEEDWHAVPSMIQGGTVQELKTQLIQAWPNLSAERQEQVRTMPAVWTTLRRLLSHGHGADQDFARNTILQAVSRSQSGDPSEEHPGEPMDWPQFWGTLWMQQATFDHCMWSLQYSW